MRKYLAVLLLTAMIGHAQSPYSQPKMVAKFYKGDSSEAFHNALNAVVANLAQGDNAVFRICSKLEPVEAFATAAGRPITILRDIKHYRLALNDLYFATFSGCGFASSSVPGPVEFWAVPRNTHLETDTIIAANRLSFMEFSDPANIKEFTQNIASFKKHLQEHPHAFGFILTYSLGKRNKKLNTNLQRAERILGKPGSALKYKSFRQTWDGIEDSYISLDYPYLLIVELS